MIETKIETGVQVCFVRPQSVPDGAAIALDRPDVDQPVLAPSLLPPDFTSAGFFSSYTTAYSMIYDSGSVPRRAIFSPRETSRQRASF